MTLLATVLYEDTMRPGADGSYPLHDLVMRMVEDEINGQTWELRKRVAKNPRRGIGNVLNDVKTRTGLLAGTGKLFLLIDLDRIAEHLKLPKSTTEADLVAKLKTESDAADKLCPFFLRPNVEGLLKDIQACDPTVLPGSLTAALEKELNERDLVFNEVKKLARRPVRDCIRRKQPGLDGLARAISALIPQ